MAAEHQEGYAVVDHDQDRIDGVNASERVEEVLGAPSGPRAVWAGQWIMRTTSPARYPSDLTDEQWALIEDLVAVKPGGRPAAHPRRRVVDAILYVNRAGCSWRMLSHDFSPWSSVFKYFQAWAADGTLDRIHDALRSAA